ncbi:MAG TPA: hypothetical protein VHV31_10620 [Nitrolancea sp.]|jgi:hypothetical protein|nr:hypothetical protein [Nitrolancea sp.]
MFRFRRINLRLLAMLAVLAILATAAYGFAANNSVPTTQAGDGSATISGFTITNVHYQIDPTDSTRISNVFFTTDAAAGDVQAQLVASGAWYTCASASGLGLSWNCSVAAGTGTKAANVNSLRVVAVQ